MLLANIDGSFTHQPLRRKVKVEKFPLSAVSDATNDMNRVGREESRKTWYE
jgi:hypothetical protein